MTRRASLLCSFAATFAVVVACGDAELASGVDEPLAVHGAQFVRGELPGLAPDTQANPRPTAATPGSLALRPRLAGVPFSGWASADALSIAARLGDVGDGYWVLPTGPLDPAVPGSRTWRFVADFHEVPPGRHELLVSAFDEAGRVGSRVSTSLCIGRLVPDNGNACDPKKAPPELVVSLAWDRAADLDLVVVTPANDLISSRSPALGLAEGERIDRNQPASTKPGSGYLDLDSNRGCAVDGRHVENVVFPERPSPGSYLVYVNLHDACHQAVTSYSVEHWARSVVDQAARTYEPLLVSRTAGRLAAVQARADSHLGTFVTEIVVP